MKVVILVVWLLACASLVVFGVRGYHEALLAKGSRIELLLQDPTVGAAAGLIHGEARVTKLDGGRAPCAVSYRRGKSSHDVTVQNGAQITFADGRTFTASEVDFLSSYRPSAAPSREESLRIQRELDIDASNSPDVTCVTPDEPMYVVGCLPGEGGTKLVACRGEDGVLLAPGKRSTLFVASYAARGVAWLAAAMLGALLGGLMLWLQGAFLRPVVRDLSEHARETARAGASRDLFWVIFPGACVIGAIAFLAVRGRSGFYVLTMLVVVLACLFVYFIVAIRFRRVHAALKIVRSTSTSKLSDAGDEIREMSVRVAPDAARIDPIGGEHRPAFVRATIIEVRNMPGQKGKTTEVSVERAVLSYPRRLPIVDEASATLDMEGCRLDTRPQNPVKMKGALDLPEWASEALPKSIEAAEHHKEFLVQWAKLDPGDPLLVYGQVARVSPGEGEAHQRAATGYRTAPVALAVQGKAVAYHGDERELERGLARERVAAVAVALALGGAIVATIAASIHAATLV